MTTLSPDEAREMLAGMIEPMPTGMDAPPDSLWMYCDGWWPTIDPLTDLNAAVRCCEAAKAEWAFLPCGTLHRNPVALAGNKMVAYSDRRHAHHLMEALLSAVKGEQVRINMEGDK